MWWCQKCQQYIQGPPPPKATDLVIPPPMAAVQPVPALVSQVVMPPTPPMPVMATCPKCKSISVSAQKQGFGAKKGCCAVLLAGPFGLLCGFCGGNKTWSHCANCGHRWKP
jgi:hypothetical protein